MYHPRVVIPSLVTVYKQGVAILPVERGTQSRKDREVVTYFDPNYSLREEALV